MFHWAMSQARFVAAAVGCVCFLSAHGALSTYSIVVADSASGQVGVAVASCVGAFDLAPLLRVVPGIGAVQVQAHYGFYGQMKLAALLEQGVAPRTALDLVTAPDFDPKRALRQYAVVDFFGRAAAFTGADDGIWAGDRQGSVGSLHYSAQGNLLTASDVLSALESGLASAQACDLAERLLLALEAVARVPGSGDRRCTPRGISADSGSLRVAGIDGSALVELDARNTGAAEPAVLLRQSYDTFRSRHPCGSLLSQAVSCERRSSAVAELSSQPTRAFLGSAPLWSSCLAALIGCHLFAMRRGLTRATRGRHQ